MQDRIPLYPGRVKMTPVAGQANTYDMVRADDPTQAGTPLNKASLLKDATAALYGLTSSAVPDDIFAAIGKYKQYWWRRRTKTINEAREDISSVVKLTDTSNSVPNLYYSKSITIDQDGVVSLVDPVKLYSIASSSSDATLIQNNIQPYLDDVPYYVSGDEYNRTNPYTIFYIPSGSSVVYKSNSDTVTICFYRYSSSRYYMILGVPTESPVAKIVTGNIVYGDWQYIQSSSRNTYPDSGTQDGYEYEYLGVPFDNAVTAPKIETGTYTGTGLYGESNPVTLTFQYKPQIVFLNLQEAAHYNSIPEHYILYQGTTSIVAYGTSSMMPVSWNGKTVSWYSTNAEYQMNKQEKVYRYMAICL